MKNFYTWCGHCGKTTWQEKLMTGLIRCLLCGVTRNEKLKDANVRDVFKKVRS